MIANSGYHLVLNLIDIAAVWPCHGRSVLITVITVCSLSLSAEMSKMAAVVNFVLTSNIVYVIYTL